MHSAAEARSFAHELYLMMKYSDVSDVDLYHGNMRFDVNVSVSADPNKLGVRSETKNLNSFRSVERAVEYEIKRQIDLLEKGKPVVQETLGWDESKQKTYSQRSKEEAHDYRYMPEPDIPPIQIKKEDVAKIAKSMPLLPNALRERFGAFGLNTSQINIILDEPELADLILYVTEAHDQKTARTIANWSLGELQRLYTEGKITWTKARDTLDHLVKLASMLDGNLLSSSAAKDLLYEIVSKNVDPEDLAKSKNLLQVSDEGELVMIIENVIGQNAKAAEDVRKGEIKAIGFLVGQVMKASGGRANPGVVQALIKKQLGT
jgi:aspartyl-tRNA(Asn)/glutamyl-tRNA(Gln) amidotransferase subunit B